MKWNIESGPDVKSRILRIKTLGLEIFLWWDKRPRLLIQKDPTKGE